MTNWQTGVVDVDGLAIHYTRTGGVKPSLVLAHGFSDDGLCWTPVTQALEADYDIIMIDARGHGRSDAPESGYSPLDHAADVAAVITALNLRRPAVLGHSMGAATTLAFAGAYPDLPGAILLEDPPPWWMAAEPASMEEQEKRWAGMRAWVLGLKRKTRDELIAVVRADSPLWPEAELGPWADSKHRLSLNVMNRHMPVDIDWAGLFGRITAPALLITADPARGAIITSENAVVLQQAVPQLQIAHIAGAGHNIRRDQFDLYLAAVRAFLAANPIA